MTRTLVAGIGNLFFGDDAFGVAVVRRLAERPLPAEVQIVDFGIRGFDLACALSSGNWDRVILVDAVQRGGSPGTVYLIAPDPQGWQITASAVEPHGLDPLQALRLAQQLAGDGVSLPPLTLVGCEPQTLGNDEDPVMGLSAVVEEAVGEATRMIESLLLPACRGAIELAGARA